MKKLLVKLAGWGRWLLYALAVWFIVVAVVVVGVGLWQRPVPQVDFGIILGAGIYSPAVQNRTLEGLRLYRAGLVKTLVLTGGKAADRKISEAEYMATLIARRGERNIPLILEDASTNTYENIAFSKVKTGPGSAVIISDRYHVARGALLALRMGYYPVYWSAPPTVAYRPLELVYYYIREVLAIMRYTPALICGCEVR